MKKILLVALVAITAFACGNDDDTTSSDASIVGTFDLTNFNSPFNDDYNNDGTTSSNLLDEVPCFMNTITFNANGDYSSTATTLEIEIDGENTSADCEGPFTETGTYELNGNTLTIDQETTTDPDGEVDFDFNNANAVVTSNTLTLTSSTAFGEVVFVYDRQ